MGTSDGIINNKSCFDENELGVTQPKHDELNASCSCHKQSSPNENITPSILLHVSLILFSGIFGN